MTDIFREAIWPLNLPFTILLGMALLYWLIVILGAVDFDWMPDLDADTVDLDADIDADLDADASGGLLTSLSQLLGIGDVPSMVVFSIIILSLWCFSMMFNHFLNPAGSYLIGAGLIVLNIIISVFFTALVTRLIVKLIGPLTSQDTERQKILYQAGTVITSEVNPGFGQVEIQGRGAPITINARAVENKIFLKGDRVLILDEDKEKGIFFVDKYNED
jgi:hypothetical protein